MKGRSRHKHTPTTVGDDVAVEVPVVLPHATFTVHDDGTMTVTVDGTAYEPQAYAPPWRRKSFPAIVDALTGQRRTPIRVEVRESNGVAFTDFITPARRRRQASLPEPTAQAVRALVTVDGGGFVPGEDVAVAVVVAHSEAGPDGTARGLLTPDLLAASPTGEVILLGRVSGALTVGHPE